MMDEDTGGPAGNRFLRPLEKPTTEELARFMNYVHITKSCWLWIGYINKKGYGLFGYRCRSVVAHRFSYRMFVGVIELGKMILHKRECGNRNCINPHHLYMGTNDDNMRDMRVWGNVATGERQGSSKLSKEDVLNIRRIHKNRRSGYKETADIYGVHESNIGLIVRGVGWEHVLQEA